MELSDSENNLGKKFYMYTNECLITTAELLRPKKREKIEDLSTITLGYILNKTPQNFGEKQRLRVLFDSGCSATLIYRSVLKKLEEKTWRTYKMVNKSWKIQNRQSL